MSKIVLTQPTSGYNLAAINDNFQKIQDEFQNKVLYRNNTSGEANTLATPLDANAQRIINLTAPQSSTDAARLADVQAAISGLPTAALVPFTPTGGIAANNVQGAIAEVDSEKANKGANSDITSLSGVSAGGIPFAAVAGVVAVGGNIGAATATTPAVTDNSTRVSTTAFAKLLGERYNGFIALVANTTFTAATHVGVAMSSANASVLTHTLPALSATVSGDVISLYNIGTASCIVQRAGSDSISAQGVVGATALVILPGDNITLVNQGGVTWTQQSGSYSKNKIVQVQSFATGAMSTGTTVIPFDNTIPQITEGDQYLTLNITPTSTLNLLEVDVVFIGACSASASGGPQVALFQNGVSNALAAVSNNVANGTFVHNIFKHVMVAGTLSTITFSVRAGGSSGTTTFNGSGGVQYMGGVIPSRITVKEYLN